MDPRPLNPCRPGDAVVARCLRVDPQEIGWDWGSGLLGHALLAWPAPARRDAIARWISAWCGHHLTNGTSIHDRGGRMWKIGVGTSLLWMRERSASPDVEASLRNFADYIEASPRLAGGIFDSKPPRAEVWVDTLMTLCPFLVRADAAGIFPGGRALAESQLRLHAAHLQDTNSGLWGHAARVETGEPMGCCWSRGNGWALFALVEVMSGAEASPESGGETGALRRILRTTVQGLLACQRQDGGWSTVMNDPDSFVESSGQAMIVHGLAKAAREGLLGEELTTRAAAAALRGAELLAARVSPEGEVTGTSIGTDALDPAYYASRPTASWPLWGPASVLLACAELMWPPRDISTGKGGI